MVTRVGEQTWPGRRFGATAAGVGSAASMGRRVGAFVIDIGLSAALALAFTWPEPPKNLSLYIWAGVTVLTVALFGMTPGHWALGLRVASIHGATFVGAWAIPRTVLVFLIVPPLLTDADGRGWHDRLCRTIVLRTR
jgi:uncharacterized RDD family membrane protein YckC